MADIEERQRDLLRAGIITLSGGHDQHENLILTIPTDKISALERWKVDDLTSMFLCQAGIARYMQSPSDGLMTVPRGPFLVCVADLRVASSTSIKQLVDMLEGVEYQQRGTVASVYFLKPQNKSKSHNLKKLLGVKPSKKNPKVPLFKIFLVKTLQDLHTNIDVSQLTLDFYGTLQYNHHSWMHIHEVVIQCISRCQRLLGRLPGVRDKVDLLQEYEAEGQTSAQLQQLLADLTEKYHMVLQESGLPKRLLETKQTLLSLDHPSVDDPVSVSCDAVPGVKPALKECLHQVYSRLEKHNEGLEQAWRLAEGRLSILFQVQRHRERAKEIEQKISQHYQPLLQEHPIVGRTLSQAELYRAHFTTTLHEPAKELLSQATEILEAVQRLKSSETMQTISTVLSHRRGSMASSELVSLDVSDITQCLTSSMEPFAGQLQHLQQLYVNIHIFHLLFEKALSWYKKALKFLPESLLERCSSDTMGEATPYGPAAPQTRETMLLMPSEWLGAVRVFLSRHPPPRHEHIDRLDESTPHLVDKKMRTQARSLALRLRLLQRILSSTRLPLRLLQAVLSWRAELFGSTQGPAHRTDNPTETTKSLQKEATTTYRGSGGIMFSNKEAPPKPRRQNAAMHAGYEVGGVQGRQQPHRLGEAVNITRTVYQNARDEDEDLQQTNHHGGRGHPPAQQHRKTATSRSMLRSRSVDFKFNSSSTDGSVLDYDKAVLGAKAAQGLDGSKSGLFIGDNRTDRKQQQQQQSFVTSDHLSSYLPGEDHALSDPSEMAIGKPRNRMSLVLPDRGRGNSSSLAHKYNDGLWTGSARTMDHGLVGTDNGMGGSGNNQERFVRINLTPNKVRHDPPDEFIYPSTNEDFEHAYTATIGAEEEESGFDTADGDPYDGLIHRIQEISSSNYTNEEKLSKVSELLLRRDRVKSALSDSPTSKLKPAQSTFDLRLREQEFPDQYNQSNELESERPAALIQRMKQKLARSVEDLSMTQSERNTTTHTSKTPRQRYRSELKIEPVFKPRQENKPTPARRKAFGEGRMPSLSDAETSTKYSPTVTSSQPEGTSRTQTTSDVEADPLGHLPTFLEDEHWPRLAGGFDGNDDMSFGNFIPRESSATRTFISPSFLRAAVSMQDLSDSRPLTAANLGLLQEMEAEADLQALRDMDILQDLQDNDDDHSSHSTGHLQPRSYTQFKQNKEYVSHSSRPTRTFSNEQSLTGYRSGDTDPQNSVHYKLDSPQQVELKEPRKSDSRLGAEGQSGENFENGPIGKDIVTNFVLFDSSKGFSNAMALQDVSHLPIWGVHDRSPEIETSSCNTALSWIPRTNATSRYKPSGSFSSGEAGLQTGRHIKSTYSRLKQEAHKEQIYQDDVAQSLKNTQRILEEEERRQKGYHTAAENVSHSLEYLADQGERMYEGQGQMASRSTSTDNGYNSWASHLVSAFSTSTDGGGTAMAEGTEERIAEVDDTSEHDNTDWKNSSSSEDD